MWYNVQCTLITHELNSPHENYFRTKLGQGNIVVEEVRHASTNHYIVKFSAFAWTLSRDRNDITALNL